MSRRKEYESQIQYQVSLTLNKRTRIRTEAALEIPKEGIQVSDPFFSAFTKLVTGSGKQREDATDVPEKGLQSFRSVSSSREEVDCTTLSNRIPNVHQKIMTIITKNKKR